MKAGIAKRIRIIIADDHLVVRQGLRAIMATEVDFEVVGEACDGLQTCDLYRRLRPDLLVLDLRMPVMDGISVVKTLIAEDPKARILVMTTYDTDEDIWVSLRAGAKGFLLKDARHSQIVEAIRTVARGDTFTTPDLALKITRRAKAPELTPREREVLKLLAAGKTNKEIGLDLNIGEGTIKTHVKSILGKLGATTRTEAAQMAMVKGLLV